MSTLAFTKETLAGFFRAAADAIQNSDLEVPATLAPPPLPLREEEIH